MSDIKSFIEASSNKVDDVYKIARLAISSIHKKEKNQYLLTYDVNGGKEFDVSSLNIPYDTEIILEYPTRDGYTFVGWSKNATDKQATYANEASVTNLSTNIIQIGQVLKIPSKYSEYTIKKGDTLWAIARDNNTSVSVLTKINNLKTTTLQIGQKILIPN